MERPHWYLDELRYAGPEHLDQVYAGAYDQKARTDWSADLALLRDLGLDEAKTLVDLGAGTGSFALAAAPLCRRVVAVDVSPAMLAVLGTEMARLRLTNVDVVRAGFLSYEHRGAPADFVYSRNALHHLPDFWKAVALHRISALLLPGGVFRLRDLVYSFDPGEAAPVLEAWLAAAQPRPEEGWTRPELETHLREEYSTFSWLMEPMLQRAGFVIQDAEYSPSRTFAAYVCRKA